MKNQTDVNAYVNGLAYEFKEDGGTTADLAQLHVALSTALQAAGVKEMRVASMAFAAYLVSSAEAASITMRGRLGAAIAKPKLRVAPRPFSKGPVVAILRPGTNHKNNQSGSRPSSSVPPRSELQ